MVASLLMKLSGQKNQVMRAIETLSEAYIWENFWNIFAPVSF